MNLKAFKLKYLSILLIILISFISYNGLLTFCSLLVLLISLNLVTRPNEPPIFSFIIIYHWIQISIKIFHSNIIGESINSISLTDSAITAINLSLIGLLIFSIGISISLRKMKLIRIKDLHDLSNYYSIKKVFIIYVIFLIIYIFLKRVMLNGIINNSGITQIILGFLNFKSVFIYILFLLSLLKKKYKFLLLVLITEVIIGLTGFFSGFKEPFIILFLAYFTINKKISLKSLRFILPVFSLLLIMILFWTSIKPSYRKSINKNDSSMVVNVSASEQFAILSNVVKQVEIEDLQIAIKLAALRLSYTDFFGYAIDNVPQNINHENGKLWFGAFTHFLKPRILFPNKEVLDDSQRTNKYTREHFADFSKGVSISIGYYAESYIDFGYLMFIMLFILGLLYGNLYKLILLKNKNVIIPFAFIIVIFSGTYTFETRNDKLIGGIFTASIMFYLIWKFVIPNNFYLKSIHNRINNDKN